MKKLKDKVVGKAKEVVAEIIGNRKLRDEAKEQQGKVKQESNEINPFDNLNRLT